MHVIRTIAILLSAFFFCSAPGIAQPVPDAERDATRAQVRGVLESAGPRSDVAVTFRQSTKNPYNFVGSMTGLKNADSLEVVISVTKNSTVGFRIYPHYKNAYINLANARERDALMRKLLYFNDQNFLFWGADDTGDIFCGYTVTLESGFPSDAIVVILRSIRNADRFVGEMRPFIDGTSPS